MRTSSLDSGIDEYLRERLMPVEGAIPHLPGIEMYGGTIPAGTVGGDLFEYINFQQRYDIDTRIEQTLTLSKEFLVPHPPGMPDYNSVDDHVEWLKSKLDYRSEMAAAYREARSLEQLRVAEDPRDLYGTAGVLVVDAQGHGVIATARPYPRSGPKHRLFKARPPDLMVLAEQSIGPRVSIRSTHTANKQRATRPRTNAAPFSKIRLEKPASCRSSTD
jgi:hypothetical protein